MLELRAHAVLPEQLPLGHITLLHTAAGKPDFMQIVPVHPHQLPLGSMHKVQSERVR